MQVDFVEEGVSEITLKIKSNSTKYIKYIFKLRCMSDILEYELFPNPKEFTESLGIYKAVVDNIPNHFKQRTDISLISVGDGTTPRTAALFSFLTRWDCYSIDPALKLNRKYDKIQRLKLIKEKAPLKNRLKLGKTFIVGVHAHVKLRDMLNCVESSDITLVVLPCCIDQSCFGSVKPAKSYRDIHIWSPKNKIYIFENLRSL